MKYNQIPVLLLLFNRPDITEILIDKLKEIQPQKIYIAQDGPRNVQEKIKTDKVKNLLKSIDWDCDVKYLIRNYNLGCYDAVVGGINRFFEHEEFGIILEDDCIPNKSFFKLCTIANKLHKNNKKIGLISGSNYQTQTKSCKNDFLFSGHTPLLRGRATWKDRRELFKQKDNIKLQLKGKKLALQETSCIAKKAITRYMLGGYWDSDWYMICYFYKLLTIVPKYNHISNIGCVGIHNARPGKYHTLQQFEVGYDGKYDGIKTISSEQYDKEMLSFLKRMYIYGIIENTLKHIGLYNLAKKTIISLAKKIYKKKLA